MTEPRTALVTGSSGFIGYHLCRQLLDDGFRVVGLDAMTDYYDVRLKERRRAMLRQSQHFSDVIAHVESPGVLAGLVGDHRPEIIVHLAAQAGVRWSVENPRSFLEGNIAGSFELLEAGRQHPPKHMLMASTSSVYGANTQMPYAETDRTNHQMSFYAATKKAVEAMSHSYAHIHGLPVTMFRFFTVYGPWGRPDMALFKFTRAILEGRPIDVYNHGEMRRDFTYIDDLIRAIRLLIDVPPGTGRSGPKDSLSPVAPWRVVNVGNSSPVALGDFITAIETATGRTAERRYLPMQQGDVPATWADASLLEELTGYRPGVDIVDGVKRFVDWYRDYYNV